MDKKYVGNDIPRLSKEQMQQQIKENEDFMFTETVSLADLIKTTTSISFLPLEEASHAFWTFGRVVCVGDSIHKMTPNVSYILGCSVR